MQLESPDLPKRTQAAEQADWGRADAAAGVDAIFAPRLCLIDPNPVTRGLLAELLHDKGFDVVETADMAALPSAVELLIFILDGVSPQARRPAWLVEQPAVPVIVLDRPHLLSGLVAPLGFTPDARLGMPVPPRKLIATIRQMLSRARIDPTPAGETAVHVYHFCGWTLHVRERRLASHDGQSVALSRQECELLVALLRFPRQVLSRQQLVGAIRGTHKTASLRTLDGPIRRLRRHLGEDVRFPRLIKTVVGVGYRLDADVETAE